MPFHIPVTNYSSSVAELNKLQASAMREIQSEHFIALYFLVPPTLEGRIKPVPQHQHPLTFNIISQQGISG